MRHKARHLIFLTDPAACRTPVRPSGCGGQSKCAIEALHRSGQRVPASYVLHATRLSRGPFPGTGITTLGSPGPADRMFTFVLLPPNWGRCVDSPGFSPERTSPRSAGDSYRTGRRRALVDGDARVAKPLHQRLGCRYRNVFIPPSRG